MRHLIERLSGRNAFPADTARAGYSACIMACMAAGALLWLVSSGFTNVGPHRFTDSQCLDCHTEVPVAGAGREQIKFVAPINELCKACHGRIAAVTHSLCVTPSFGIDSSLPLEKGCGITCATCHDPHMQPVDPDTSRPTHLLRDSAGGLWHCDICHKSELSKLRSLTHRPSMDTAHGYAHFKVVGDEETLDPLSVLCLDCHDRPDKIQQTDVSISSWEHGTNTFIPHRVGILYEEAAWKNDGLKLADRDKALPLFDGRIGCCTCHDPYKPGGGMQLRLGTPDNTEPLCRGCHLNR